MIQGLLGGAGLIGGERKISITGVLEGSSASLSPSPSPSSSSAAAAPPSSTSASDSQNQLRCPRCDSTNTKFCYYNNYNLTQPRHFCKTCRRYWTKGGALRNVPIGGGCRKNKNVSVTATVGKPTAGRLKCSTDQIGKSGLLDGFNQEVAPNPILWASPQNSHLLALLRANQNTNPNPNPNPISNSVTVKEESPMIGSHMNSETAVATGGLNARALGSDPFNQVSSVGLCGPFWRSNQHRITQQQQQLLQQNGFVLGEVQNSSGIQDLYQRLRSSANYYPVQSQVLLSNVGSSSSSSSSSTIFESAPVVTSEMAYWNPALSWSDQPATNGAYP